MFSGTPRYAVTRASHWEVETMHTDRLKRVAAWVVDAQDAQEDWAVLNTHTCELTTNAPWTFITTDHQDTHELLHGDYVHTDDLDFGRYA